MNRPPRPKAARHWPALALAVVVALAAPAACDASKDPSADPFKPCPHGYYRARDPLLPPGKWWACMPLTPAVPPASPPGGAS